MQDKVLIITLNMIPYSSSWGNSQRMYFLAQHLVKNGIKVYAVCLQEGTYNDFGKKINYEIKPLPIKNNFINYTKSYKYSSKTSISKSFKNIIVNKFKVSLLKVLNSFYNEPSALNGLKGHLWVLRNKKEIENFIIEKDIVKVIISAPPFTVYKMVNRIKNKLPTRKIILDYRDPWNLWNNKKGISYYKEKKVLNASDKVIAFSLPYYNDIISNYNIHPSKMDLIYNGFSEDAWNKINLNSTTLNKKLTISHIGTINFQNEKGYRNVTELLDAIDTLSYKDDIELEFVGVDLNEKIKDIQQKYNFTKFIEKVPQEESLEYMIQSDVLLLLHNANDNSSKYIISAKLFDYIKSNKPILGIGDKFSLHHKLILKYHLGFYAENKVNDIIKNIDKFFTYWKNNDLKKIRNQQRLDVNIFSREFQNDKYFKIIKSL